MHSFRSLVIALLVLAACLVSRPARADVGVAAPAITAMTEGTPAAVATPATPATTTATTEVRVLAWNIWRGGREDGDEVGPARVVDVIRSAGADVVAMQETYGSGERIAAALGFSFLPRGTNVSIHSRYRILEDISVHEPFKCVGALLELPAGGRLAVYSIWLPYDAEIWEAGTRDSSDVPSMLAACASSAVDLRAIRDAIHVRLAGDAYAGVPVVIAGDFNSMSHLDYADVARDQYAAVVDWPTSHVMSEAGYRDVYREQHPVIDRAADRTWTPRFPGQEQDRIDFVYVRGEGIEPTGAAMIDIHPDGFPSDHAALLAVLEVEAESGDIAPEPEATTSAAPDATPVQAATYNIKHGRGMDGQVNLDRTTATLRALAADVIGLQEVDERAGRSAGVNQAAELGRRLGMHAAFAPFMDYDGGRYGMAVLSRFPIRSTRVVPLPGGNEPRVALAVEVRLPSGESVTVVNVHFDWVNDDTFRFAQATALAEVLGELDTPYILLGDFNDQPGSRTLMLFAAAAREADKPDAEPDTFPADFPAKEIDFIFGGPAPRWRVGAVRVVPEAVASDHRPVVAELVLTRAGG